MLEGCVCAPVAMVNPVSSLKYFSVSFPTVRSRTYLDLNYFVIQLAKLHLAERSSSKRPQRDNFLDGVRTQQEDGQQPFSELTRNQIGCVLFLYFQPLEL